MHGNDTHDIRDAIGRTRRDFLTTTASGLGMLALGNMLTNSGVLSPDRALASSASLDGVNPLAARPPHFAPKAKNCIFFFMEGAPSQIDLFDPKPKLNELHGQTLPASMLEKVRFAFIKKDAKLLGSKRIFSKHGQCGMELSDLLPHVGSVADDITLVRTMHTDQFNHHPAQLLMQCGRSTFGLPTLGSWLTYGLGSESENLPGYVVLSAGVGSSAGVSLFQSGFLPSVYAGVPFRSQGEAVLNLQDPAGLPGALRRRGLDALRDLNQTRYQHVHDPEIASRISAYELAFRMQAAAPELIDLSNEPQYIRDMYGVDRKHASVPGNRGGGADAYSTFATNCLLARRLVERGVRFVNVIHASWDQHSNLDTELTFNAGMADQPVAALIRDLKMRGLLDETLVVWGSEFGRTPLAQAQTEASGLKVGRDHHPYAFSIFMAGGGIRGGQVYGETDELGWGITKNPVHVNDFHATILHLFGMDHLKLTYRFQGRDFRLTDVAGKVLPGLMA